MNVRPVASLSDAVLTDAGYEEQPGKGGELVLELPGADLPVVTGGGANQTRTSRSPRASPKTSSLGVLTDAVDPAGCEAVR